MFFNEKGPSKGGAEGGEIYIDCQPVGSSDEQIEVVTDMGGTTMSIGDWLSNPLVKLFFGSLLFIIILYAIKYLLNMLKPAKGGAIEAVKEGLNGGGNWLKQKVSKG